MKRIKIAAACTMALVALCLGVLAGCGPDNEQIIRDGVTEELDGLKNLDEAALSDIMAGADVADLATFGIDANEFMKAYLAGFDYRIDDIAVKGDKAQVTVTLTCKSFNAYEAALQEAAVKLSGDESNAELEGEALNQKIGETVMAAIATVQSEETAPIVLDYELVDKTWTPTEASAQRVAAALFG